MPNENLIEMRGHARRELEMNHAESYSLEQVAADLVDNCIDAKAENIWVVFNEEFYAGKRSFYMVIIDDGKGIQDGDISSVMDFGTERDYDELDLGKFGVGLKKSSLSQAKEVTMLSKVAGGQINLRRLSSEVVSEEDRWVLLDSLREHMDTDAIGIAKRELAELDSGSAVVLENMHKLMNRVGDTDNRKAYLDSEYDHIREYLGLVFERYIDGVDLIRSSGETVHRKVNIFFNGHAEHNLIDSLDPFCRDQKDGTVTGTLCKHIPIKVDSGEKIHDLDFKIWITPNDSDRPQGYDKRIDVACRFMGISELQGMYIYRNQRLIDFPGWKKILKHDPHMTCLRWEIHYPSEIDSKFQLDPSKRGVEPPRELMDSFKKISRTGFRWHDDDEKQYNHRRRARLRQGGKDKKSLRGSPPSPQAGAEGGKREAVSSTPPLNTPNLGNAATTTTSSRASIAPTGVKIKMLGAGKTGQLVISERLVGDKIQVTLNKNHDLFEKMLDEFKKA